MNFQQLSEFTFRISVKALVQDADGRTLMIMDREDAPGWEFPGGGMDHGEQPEVALRRELLEEIGVQELSADPKFVCAASGLPDYGTYKGVWTLWLLYKVELDIDSIKLSDEHDASDHRLMQLRDLKLEDVHPTQRLLYNKILELGL